MQYSKWYAVKGGTYQDADTMVHDLTLYVNGDNAADARRFLIAQPIQYDGREVYLDALIPCSADFLTSENSPFVLVCDRNAERNFLPQQTSEPRPDHGFELKWIAEDGLVVARSHEAGIRATSVFGWDDVARLGKAFGLQTTEEDSLT